MATASVPWTRMPEHQRSPGRMLEIDIAVEGGDWPSEEDLFELAERVIREALDVVSEIEGGQTVSLLFADDAEIRDLNARFRHKDKATNVLSFPGSPATPMPGMPPHLGDIAFAYETILREAEAEGKTFEHHLIHLLVHGILHLAGHDHEDPAEAEEMEGLERIILQALAISDPYD